MTANPFATPRADLEPDFAARQATTAGLWRKGKTLIMERTAELPDRCVKTNQPTSFRLQRKLYWHHPAVYLAFLINLILYLIIALIVRKTAVVQVPISEGARARRKKHIFIGLGIAGGSVALAVAGAALANAPGFILLGIFGGLGGLIWGLIGARVVWPTKIDDQHVHLAGCCEAFLATLPAWPY